MTKQDRTLTACPLVWMLAAAVVCCVLATPAYAQNGGQTPTQPNWSTGIRGGAAARPNQGVVGVFFESPGLTSTGHLTFRPNAEIGFGGGGVLVEGNLDVCYWATLPKSAWSLFFGGGPAAVYLHESHGGGNHTGGGVSVVLGFQHAKGLSIELRAGGGSVHGLELIAGYIIKK